jgi:DNA-binding CsgD family transcriptional regulator
MRRSQQLKLAEVRKIFRVLGDARDLCHDQVKQETVIVDAMTDLLGASFGQATRVGEFRPDRPTYLKKFVPGSIQDSGVTRYFSHWGKNSEFHDDPLQQMTWDKQGPVHTLSRSSVMSYEDVKQYRIYEEMVEPARLKDVVFTFFRYPKSNTIRQYAFQRATTQSEFEPWHLRLADLFITELHRLYREGVLEPGNPLNDLPQRLSHMARQLRTGQSQRQIALSQNLSYHTVRSYTKELYNTVGVSSREGLVEKLFRRDGMN